MDMKRTVFYLSAAAFLAVLSSCEPQEAAVQLDTPDVSIDERTETTFTISWLPVANADSYVYVLNDGEEQSTADFTATFTGLDAGEYVARVKAVSEDGAYSDSEWGEVEVIIKEVERPQSELGQNWAGNYDVSCTKTITMSLIENEDGSYGLSVEVRDEPMEFTAELVAAPSGEEYGYLYGWSFNIDKLFGTQIYAPVVLQDGELFVTSDVVATTDELGSLMWMPCLISDNGGFSIAQGLDYAFKFRKEGDDIVGVPYDVQINGETYQVGAMMLTANGASPVYTSFEDFPMDVPAGEFTLTRR